RLELEDKEIEGLLPCQRSAFDLDRALKDPSHVQIALVVVGYPTAAVVQGPANPACFEQHAGAVVSCNECVFVKGGRQLASPEIDILSTRLRRGDSLSLLRCAGDISDEASDTDLAVATDGDVSRDAFIAANQI